MIRLEELEPLVQQENKMQNTIKKLTQDSCQALGLPEVDFVIEHPENTDFGDFSTNISLVLSKQVGKNPRELASIISEEINKNLPNTISKVEVAGPGFINFYLSKDFFVSELQQILEKGEGYGTNETADSKKIVLEYTNTNVLKPFHIGHLMGNVLGESLSRIFEANGAEIARVTYQGDVGLHIGKAIWGMMQMKDSFPKDNESVSNKVKFVGDAYSYGSDKYEDNPESAEEIKIINKKAYDKSDPEVNHYYELARQWSLDHFEEIYKKLDTKFNHYFFESEVAQDALKVVNENIERGIFEKSEGAVVYKGEKFGLHTRVFISSQGLPTYEAKDIAHALHKYSLYPFDESIIITANEQNDYFRVVLSALKEINQTVAATTQHLSHGMLKLTEGKMSSRKGNVITGESLILDTEEAVREIVKDRELPEEIKEKIAQDVAVAAIKFSILRQAGGGDIIFDRAKAISFEGDSGPYLQYTAVRAASVIEKAGWKNKGASFETYNKDIYPIEHFLYRFPEVVARASYEKFPHYIVSYLIELASSFNSFYAHNKIIEAGEESEYRLGVTQAVFNILSNGLYLLGIKVPQRM